MIGSVDGSILVGLGAVVAAVGGSLVAVVIASRNRGVIEQAKVATVEHAGQIADLQGKAGSWEAVLQIVTSLQDSLASAMVATAECERERSVDRKRIEQHEAKILSNGEEIAALRRIAALDHPDLVQP